MLKSLQTLGQAKNALMRQHEIIANNLANLGANGFKKDVVAFQQVLDGSGSPKVQAVMKTDSSTGSLQPTNNLLDVALQGPGYFAVQTPEGVRYTRDGAFQINAQGLLSDRHGYPVMADKGLVALNQEGLSDFKIGSDGRVFVGGSDAGKLLITNFDENAHMNKVGQNLFQLSSGQAVPSSAHVIQGQLEMSNVNSVHEMVDMLDALRLFEANQITSRMHDEALGKAIRDLS